MKVEIQIDERCTSPTIIIRAAAMTAEIADLVRKLSQDARQTLPARKGEEIYLLAPQEVVRIYTESERLWLRSKDEIYALRGRLYEWEAQLEGAGFVRISHSELVNCRWIQSLDVSISGAISLRLKNADVAFVSRRYVERIKRHLGL